MQGLNRYPLAGLRAVEAAGRLGGLAKAAAELGVTVGAVSQHVRKIEAQLGRGLFERTARGLEPTALGEPLLAALTHAFAEMARAIAAAEQRPGALTVSVAPVFAAKWLVPRLTRFTAAHPSVQLRIDASVEIVDLDASDVDAGLRVGVGPWPTVRAERLAGLELFLVCSPAIAAAIGGSRTSAACRSFATTARPPAGRCGSPGRARPICRLAAAQSTPTRRCASTPRSPARGSRSPGRPSPSTPSGRAVSAPRLRGGFRPANPIGWSPRRGERRAPTCAPSLVGCVPSWPPTASPERRV